MPNERLAADGLLAVYPDRPTAEEAARTLEGIGVDRSLVRIDDPADETRSLAAEVREESTRSFPSPTVGVAYPKEAAKASAVVLPAMALGGAVVGALATLPVSVGDWSVLVRVVVGAIVGAAMGSAIAIVVTPAMAVRNPHDPSAAETGSTLFVGAATAPVVEALVASQPVRLDRMRGGAGVETLVTEEDHSPGGIVEELADNFAREKAADPEDRTR